MKRSIRTFREKLLQSASNSLFGLRDEVRKTHEEILQNRMLMVQPRILEFKDIHSLLSLREVEFKVFSQWGEDGIVQYLISHIEIPNKEFVEFGVGDYEESNTRFLLMNNNWRGLVLDGSHNHIARIRQSKIYWRHNLTANCAFITRENIGNLIQDAGLQGDIGLLSIDIDGNDYWVWEAIQASVISPRIVIIEYNSIYGDQKAVTIPYRADFQRKHAHYSHLYFGASIKAFWLLAQQKGYIYVGSNSAGNNAFFVRRDVARGLPELRWDEGFVESQFRESRDANGNLNFISGPDRLRVIQEQVLLDIEGGQTKSIQEIFGLPRA